MGRMDGWIMYNRVFLLCSAAKDPAMLDEETFRADSRQLRGPEWTCVWKTMY